MENGILRVAECSICMDTLTAPIRNLPCGHNYCHVCLEQFFTSNENINCPNCRRRIPVESRDVQLLPRQHILENVIEKIRESYTRESERSPVLSGDVLKQLRDMASIFKSQGNFKGAIQTLNTIIHQEKGYAKILPTVEKIKCRLLCGEIKETSCDIAKLISIMDSHDILAKLRDSGDISEECDNSIEKLTLEFVERDFETTSELIFSRFHFVKHLFYGESKLKKLNTIPLQFYMAGRELKKRGEIGEMAKHLDFLYVVIDEIQAITDVDMKAKCETLTQCYKYVGGCCRAGQNYESAIENFALAISYYKTVWGSGAQYHKYFGSCYESIGAACVGAGNLERAKSSYEEAIEVYKTATNWPSEERKSRHIITLKKKLKEIKLT